jgi:hypothetical protein
LRAAIQEANHPTNLGANFIGFNIGGGIGVKTISPRSELPAITEQLTINGYTQPGATENTDARPGKTNARPLVELDGPTWRNCRWTGSTSGQQTWWCAGSLSTASRSTASTFARTPTA